MNDINLWWLGLVAGFTAILAIAAVWCRRVEDEIDRENEAMDNVSAVPDGMRVEPSIYWSWSGEQLIAAVRHCDPDNALLQWGIGQLYAQCRVHPSMSPAYLYEMSETRGWGQEFMISNMVAQCEKAINGGRDASDATD